MFCIRELSKNLLFSYNVLVEIRDWTYHLLSWQPKNLKNLETSTSKTVFLLILTNWNQIFSTGALKYIYIDKFDVLGHYTTCLWPASDIWRRKHFILKLILKYFFHQVHTPTTPKMHIHAVFPFGHALFILYHI